MEGSMTVFRRELAFAARGPGVNTGDWWHLILDPDAPGLYVEHSWKHTSTVVDDQTASGSERFGINDFLTLAQGQPARPVLLAALSEMFRNSGQNGQETSR
jgi:hypothetical protein